MKVVLEPSVPAAHDDFPAGGLSLCLGLGTDVTQVFFRERQARLTSD